MSLTHLFSLAPHPFFLFFAWQLKLRGQEGIWEAITVVCFGSLTPTPSPWLCRSNAATLPACCLGNKHIFNHPGPASAKATLAEPCLTSSGQKSWTAIWWTQAIRVKPCLLNPGHISGSQTVKSRSYSLSSLCWNWASEDMPFNLSVCSTQATLVKPRWSNPGQESHTPLSVFRPQKSCCPGWNQARKGWSVFGWVSSSVVMLATCWLTVGSSDVNPTQLRAGNEVRCKTEEKTS